MELGCGGTSVGDQAPDPSTELGTENGVTFPRSARGSSQTAKVNLLEPCQTMNMLCVGKYG